MDMYAPVARVYVSAEGSRLVLLQIFFCFLLFFPLLSITESVYGFSRPLVGLSMLCESCCVLLEDKSVYVT